MQIRQILLLLTLATSAVLTPSFAQSSEPRAQRMAPSDDRKAEMNRVKQSTDYYWSEASAPTADEAYALATSKLVIDIQTELDGADVDSAAVVSHAQRIDIPRGTNVRVFVYTLKTNVAASPQSATSTSTDNSSTTTSSQQTSSQQTSSEQTSSEQTSETAVQPTAVATSLSALTTTEFDDLLVTLEQLRQTNAITSYGKCTRNNVSQIPQAYLVIIDVSARKIRAVLTPEQNGQRHNLATGAVDATSNYHRCNGLWVLAK